MKTTVDRFPRIMIELTRACNLRCVMCPVHAPGAQLPAAVEYPPHMDWSLYLSILGQIKYLREKINVIPVVFGEPLLNPDIFWAIALANADDHKCYLTTNGTRLGRTATEKLLNLGLGYLCISIDTATEAAALAVRSDGYFAQTCWNTDQFIEQRNARRSDTLVYISACKLPQYAHEMPALLERWRQADIVSVTNVLYQNGQEWNWHPKRIPCGWLWKGGLVVLSNGDCVPCCSPTGMSLVLGNAKEQRLEDILNGRVARGLRQRHLDHDWDRIPQCAKCNNWTSYNIEPRCSIEGAWQLRTFPLHIEYSRNHG